VAGNTLATATSVKVNGQAAQIYNDLTFAGPGNVLANGLNAFTNIAQNSAGLTVTNKLSVNLPTNTTLAYDANGNLTNDGLKSLSFDVENELTNIAVAGQWQSGFVYDGLGRRRIERDYAWANGMWVQTNEVHYIYDGNLILQERDINNRVLVTYTRGRDLSGSIGGAGGIGGLLGRTDANGSAFYHADGLGNITALINSSNNLVAQYLYSPFGQVIAKWGAYQDLNEMQFSSVPHHNPSGYSMFPYRVYDAVLMRWVSSDPIGELGGLNLYGFVFNSPPNLTDPMGLFAPMTLPSAFKTVTTMTEMAGTVGAGTTLVGGAALAGTASIMSPFVIGFLGMNLQNDPYLNPNGVNAPPDYAYATLPKQSPVVPFPLTTPNSCPPKQKPLILFHYSQNPPASFINGLRPGAFVTPIGGMDSKTAMFDLSINPPLYQYTFSIDSSALGPVNNSNPGRVPQYEVTQQTGARKRMVRFSKLERF
jgi:RHS repeat-associated protein